MIEEVKVKWLKKLRDPNTKQGKGQLRLRNCGATFYCCLGALNAVCPKKYGLRADISDPNFPATMLDNPEVVGIGTTDMYRLAGMNDNGDTFAYIADYIEANL